MFDVSSEKSFRMAERWRDDIQSKMAPDPNVPILLLANKVCSPSRNSHSLG